MSFREWLTTYEREQEHHSNQIAGLISAHSQLSSEVATISANVQTLLNNQSSLSERMNRPWQWGVVVAVFLALFSISGAFATVLTLTVNPIKDSVTHAANEHKAERENQLKINMWMREYMENNRNDITSNKETLRLLEKLEARYNEAYGLQRAND